MNENQSTITIKAYNLAAKLYEETDARLGIANPEENYLFVLHEHLQETYFSTRNKSKKTRIPLLRRQLDKQRRDLIGQIEEEVLPEILEWTSQNTPHESNVVEYARIKAQNYKHDFDELIPEAFLDKGSTKRDFNNALLDITATYHAITSYEDVKRMHEQLEEGTNYLANNFYTELLPNITQLSPYATNPIELIEDILLRMREQDEKTQKEFIPLANTYIQQKITDMKKTLTSTIDKNNELLSDKTKYLAKKYYGKNQQIYIVNEELTGKARRVEFLPLNRDEIGSFESELDKVENEARKKAHPELYEREKQPRTMPDKQFPTFHPDWMRTTLRTQRI